MDSAGVYALAQWAREDMKNNPDLQRAADKAAAAAAAAPKKAAAESSSQLEARLAAVEASLSTLQASVRRDESQVHEDSKGKGSTATSVATPPAASKPPS